MPGDTDLRRKKGERDGTFPRERENFRLEWGGGGVALGLSAESDSSPLPLPHRSTNRSVNTEQKYVGREERAIIATR